MVKYFFVLLGLLSAGASSASNRPDLCEAASSVPDPVFWFLEDHGPTVSYVSTRRGRNGGKQTIISRNPGSIWGSSYRYRDLAPQGDPRFFIMAAGRQVGSFFGYDLLSASTMAIPDADELNGAVDRFNRHVRLNERIPVLFRSSRGASARTYLRSRLQGVILFSTLFKEHVHDAAYHAEEVLGPPEFNGLVDQRAHLMMAFLKYAERRNHPAQLRGEIKVLVSELRGEESRYLDVIGGNMGYFLASSQTRRVYDDLVGIGLSPVARLEGNVKHFSGPRLRSYMRGLLREFLAPMNVEKLKEFPISADEVEGMIRARLDFIRETVARIESESSAREGHNHEDRR